MIQRTTTTGSPTSHPRARASADVRAYEDHMDMDRDHQYDLLTAALIGAAVGATATLLVATGMREARRTPTQRMVRRGRNWATGSVAVAPTAAPISAAVKIGRAHV